MPRPKRAARKRNFTELFVRNAKPEPGRAYALVWDTGQRGLALQVTAAGHKSFKAIYSRQGRARWFTIGSVSDIPLAEARTQAAEVRIAAARGQDPAAEKRAQRDTGTFAELADRYVDEYAKRRNKSWEQAAGLIATYVVPRWGKLTAASISRSDVKALMRSMDDRPVLGNQVLASVGAIFTWAAKEEILPPDRPNPCRGIERNPTRARERILADSEIGPVWKALAEVDPTVGKALRMVLLTGQRPGEVSWMRREHIKDGWWQMPGERISDAWPGTKNGRSNRVWLSQATQDLIAGEGPGFVFQAPRGGPLTNGLDRAMREVCMKLGIDPARPHDLRRTFGSMVTGLEFGRQAMDRILNHADHSVGSVYDRHSYSNEDRVIMESVAARILALVEGRDETGKVVNFLG